MAEFLLSTSASLIASILFALASSKIFKTKNGAKASAADNFRFVIIAVIVFTFMMTYVIFNFGAFGEQEEKFSSEQFLEFVGTIVSPNIRTVISTASIAVAFLLGSGIISNCYYEEQMTKLRSILIIKSATNTRI